MDYERMQKVLHSPFDVKIHKEVFTNYLEVCIEQDGTVHYAIPSHMEFLQTYLFMKENPNKKYMIANGRAPREWVLERPNGEVCSSGCPAAVDWSGFLLEKTGLMIVTNGYWNAFHPTEKQLETLTNIYSELGIESYIPVGEHEMYRSYP